MYMILILIALILMVVGGPIGIIIGIGIIVYAFGVQNGEENKKARKLLKDMEEDEKTK